MESDAPDRFRTGAVFDTDERPPRRLEVAGVRRHHRTLLVSFDGIHDRTTAEGLRGVGLTISQAERRPLEAGEHWPEDLVGLEVRRASGEPLGTVADVVLGAAQDRLVVDTPRGPVEVPFVADLVDDADVAGGYLVVNPPAGLFD